MILKVRALFSYFPSLRERENLIAAAVGQDWAIPVHEAVQSAEMANDVESWPNEKVIGVAEDDLRLERVQFRRADSLHAALRPDRHERRRLDSTESSRQTRSEEHTSDLK